MHNFSLKIYKLRDEKSRIIKYLNEKLDDLEKIHAELPEDSRRFGPAVPKDSEDENYPEKKFEVKVILPNDVLSEDMEQEIEKIFFINVISSNIIFIINNFL